MGAAVVMTSMPATAFAADFFESFFMQRKVLILMKAVQKLRTTDVVEDTEDTDVDVEEAAGT